MLTLDPPVSYETSSSDIADNSVKMKALFTAVLTLLALALFAQNEKADSLLLDIEKNGATSKKYLDICWAYVFSQPDTAIYYGDIAIALAKKEGDPSNEATGHNRVGVAFDIKNEPDSALDRYHRAIALANEAGEERTVGGALNNIGLIYWNLGQNEKAIDFYTRSAVIFEKHERWVGLANTYNNIGLILWEEERLLEAIDYQRLALKIRIDLNDQYGIGASYANIGMLFNEDIDADSALHYLLMAEEIKTRIDDQYGLARVLNNLATIWTAKEEYDKSERDYLRSIEIHEKLEDLPAAASSYFNLSQNFSEAGQHEKEVTYLLKAKEIAEPINEAKVLWKVYQNLGEEYAKSGKFEEAAGFFQMRNTIKDSLLSAERSEQIAEVEAKYQSAIKDKQISDQQIEIAEKNLRVANRNRWITAILLGAGLAILVILLIWQGNRKRLQAERDAAIISERERGLNAVITATEEERQRIAKDLHDGVVQSLTGVRLNMAQQARSLSDLSPETKKKLQATTAELDESISEIRGISHQMMPRALQESGLVPALSDMLEKSLGSSDIKVEFEHHRVENERFDPRKEVSLYRICQELVNNVIKHSEAKAVSVQLFKTKSHLALIVEDNGKGFEYKDQTKRNGIGLMNIASRVQAVQGELDYQPSPQQGTVATIRIPL